MPLIHSSMNVTLCCDECGEYLIVPEEEFEHIGWRVEEPSTVLRDVISCRVTCPKHEDVEPNGLVEIDYDGCSFSVCGVNRFNLQSAMQAADMISRHGHKEIYISRSCAKKMIEEIVKYNGAL